MDLQAIPKVSLRQKISGLIRIFRPELPFSAGVCVVVGEVVALGGLPPLRLASLGFLTGFFLSSTALILNDYFDLEVDRVNAPQRPLPSGIVTVSEVIGLGALTTLLGLATALSLGAPAFVLSLFTWGVGLLYNWKFKQAGLIGNLMVSYSVATTFILGGMAARDPWDPLVWTFGLIAFGINLGEEIAGDAMDVAGDKKRGSRSIAIRSGRSHALRISALLFALVVLLSLVPAWMGWLGASYLVMVLIMDSMIVLFASRLLRSRTPEEGRKAMRGIYLGALVGLLAFWFLAGIIGRQLVRAQARKSTDIRDFARLSEVAGRFESLMVIPGNMAVILAGIPLALVGGWPIFGFLQGGSSNWLLVTNVILLLGVFSVPLIFMPRGKVFDRALQTALASGTITPELRATLDDPVVKYAHWAENAGLFIIVVLMVLKPF